MMNIGAVSKATGIPENTLRTWERRYGFPDPERTEGGHRVYSADTVERLRLVAQALDLGHRAGQVLAADREALEQLLGTTKPAPPRRVHDVGEWLDATRRLDGEGLSSAFHVAYSRLGLVGFITERAVPFLVQVGDAWATGQLQTFHEHFASERLREFLAATWRPLAEDNAGPTVVLSTLPGDLHVIGLHMAAALLALEGCRIVFVGTDTPLIDLRDCVVQRDAQALVLAIASSAGPAAARSSLTELRRMLPPIVQIVVGGGGAPHDIPGVLHVPTLDALPRVVAALG